MASDDALAEADVPDRRRKGERTINPVVFFDRGDNMPKTIKDYRAKPVASSRPTAPPTAVEEPATPTAAKPDATEPTLPFDETAITEPTATEPTEPEPMEPAMATEPEPVLPPKVKHPSQFPAKD
jgi:hypothetical protein